jgi:hypothetical protein
MEGCACPTFVSAVPGLQLGAAFALRRLSLSVNCRWKQRGHLMTIIKPELDPADPVLDFEEHMRRFMDGTLEHGMLTKDYSKGEVTKVARQLEAQIGAEEAGAKRISGFRASSLPRELLQPSGSASGAGAQLR